MESTPTTDDEQPPLWHGLAGDAGVALPEWLDQGCTPRADRLRDGSARRR